MDIHNNQQEFQKEAGKIGRRSFLIKTQHMVGAVALTQIGILAPMTSVLANSDESANKTEPKPINVGKAEDYQPGSFKYFDKEGFYMVRMADGGFIALSPTCTHLGCTIKWHDDTKKFKCPCHGSEFDMNGNVIHKPANRPLNYYPVTIKDQAITVDIQKSIKRKVFDESQVAYAS